MGYTTEFSGSVSIEPPLNADEISFLKDFNESRRMHRSGGPLFVKGEGQYGQGNGPDAVHNHNDPDPDQPGLWCQWVASDDGTELMWDEGEKFYYATEWMEYIVNSLLSEAARPYIDQHINEDERLKNFTCDHVVNGVIYADGEESDDVWKLKVTNNLVEYIEAYTAYADDEPEVKPPSEAELRAALQSLGARTTVKVKVWTLTIDTDSIMTTVYGTEQELYDSLKLNFIETLNADGLDPDVSTPDGRSELIEFLTEQARVVLYIDEHIVEATQEEI